MDHLPEPTLDTITEHVTQAHQYYPTYAEGVVPAILMAEHDRDHTDKYIPLQHNHTHEPQPVANADHGPHWIGQPPSPGENREILIEALIGLDPGRRRLYQTSASFHAAVYTLAEMLPAWIDGLAHNATAEAERISKRIAEEMGL